jgi:glycerate kinase
LKSGVDIVIEATQLSLQMADVDLVITGAGKIDSQKPFVEKPQLAWLK